MAACSSPKRGVSNAQKLDGRHILFYFCSMEAEAAQLDDLRNAAHALGMAFAQAAMAEDDLDRKLALFDAFHRSSASVRLSIALKMRLRREARLPPREAGRPEIERVEVERPERAERPDYYDERERDRERVSFPLLLRTLSRVADDAQALLPQAAELPSLRELLDRVKAAPSPATPSAVAGNLRARLTGSATTQVLIRPPAPPGPPPGPPPRRSTGPP
jgi:hypothetical protein